MDQDKSSPGQRRSLRIIPGNVRALIEHHPNLQKVLVNISWLFGDRILKMTIGFLIGVWVARYLGPVQYGLFNYAMAFSTVFGTVATLGLNTIVVRDLVKEPECSNTTLGTAFALQIIGGILSYVLSVFFIGLIRPDDVQARLLVSVISFVMVLKSTDVVKYWFESQIRSKYSVLVENAAFLIFAAVKVVLIMGHAPLIGFVWAVLAEAFVVAIGLLFMYMWRAGQLRQWRARYQRAKEMIIESWPLVLSGLAIMVYMRIDQIMLGQMMGNNAVGIYSVAVRISEVWYFVPMAIVSSVFPSIIEAKKNDVIYIRRLQKLFDLMVLLSLTLAIPMTFLSDWLVGILFGKAYLAAGTVLAVHIWAGIFVFLGVASGQWFVIEGLQKFVFYRTFAGALLNIGLNILMIPVYGPVGAAIATVISQAVASVLFNLVNKRTRLMFVMQCKAFSFSELFRYR